MSIKTYLANKYTTSTTQAYERDINHYLQRNPKAKSATYSDILTYLEHLRKTQRPASVHRILQSIKKYYDYLLATDQRPDHPCASLRLKDNPGKDVQLQDLFTKEELQSLLDRKERYQLLKNRNQLILSLLIYQGPTTGEMIRLTTDSLDLEQGQIHLPSSHRLNGRTLVLQPVQILTGYKYLKEDRPQLIQVPTDKLLITKRGTEENGEGISYLVSTLQKRFSDRRLNPKTIRQSVIANLLASGKPLRWVQVFAGHKYPGSTERYRQTNLRSLKEAVWKHHPLG